MKRTLLYMLGLCLTLALGGASAAELGRLFLDGAERAAIDAARQGSADVRAASETSTATPDSAGLRPAQPDAPGEPVTVNGYIARSAGASTVWVNGRDMAPGKLSPPGRDGRRVKVPVGHGGAQVALKPGQSFDPQSRQVSDAYQQRPPAQP